MRILLFALSVILVSCQQPNENKVAAANAVDTSKMSSDAQGSGGVLADGRGKVPDFAKLNYLPAYASNPQNLLEGAWVSACLSQSIMPHFPMLGRLQFYRMYYYFDSANNAVAHFVQDFQDPLCEEDFGGPLNPLVNETFKIKGFYQVTRQDRNFNQVIRVNFNFQVPCAGQSCRPPQDPINGVYLNHTKMAIFRQTQDGRYALFWGENVPPHHFSQTPFLPEQLFNFNVPFLRMH